MTQIKCAEVTASEDPVLVDVTLGSDIPVMKGTFAQDLADDISIENMADTHDSYDEVLAGTGEHVIGTQVVDLEVTTPVATYMSPTRIGNWLLFNTLLFFYLMVEIS